ncbi:MAG: NAD(P)/FAD-dependent oxidoreductase [Thermodesulfobacteriota bacterium]|jgi:prolycopene isomerase
MSDADIVIIGAGMAGLTCGCLLAQKGLKVVMIEKNQKVGGCCTSFQKEGFLFDLSVQSLGECQEGGRVWRVLKQLNLLDQVRFISLEPAREYYFPDQRVIQSSRMETHIENLSSLFPAEQKGIKEVYAALEKIFEEFSSLRSSLNWFKPSSFLSRYPYLSRYKDKTYGELLDEFISNPFLKTLLSIRSSYALLPPEEISAVGMAGIEMSYFSHGVSCVDGKVEQLPMKMGEVLVRMGGEILTGHEAQQILMDEKRAIGVRLKNGQEMTGKVVVSNVDAHHTFSDLIGENHIPAGFRSKLKGMRPSLSYFILYLGIEGDVGELPISNNEIFFGDSLEKEFDFLYENRISEKAPFYLLVPSNVNPSHAPAGKSTLCLSCKVSYGFSPSWDRKTKDELSKRLIQKASAFIPNLERRILVKIETTPKTIEQWTGNRWGAAYGWAQIPRQSGIYRLPRTAPIPNLYLTGHWTSPGGGIAGVVASGELTAEAVLNRLEKGE